ncbi:hypothetical protein OPKNFCMD_6229 [Methylobacterium crusticola]|uniref:FAD-binding FR-type domain-containing protein n=1 Tax=Methylobacterium crusticola TaxID=1697972 RepID=A0ABQ4R8K8_9HYPH|nr:siderophore-interacting protein [Methylobacterium crusticola]GJD53454.1 hypothetical protein OPKNFCMD_6229 [Methylobacterium crusticola]
MTTLVSEARVWVAEPARIVGDLCAHFLEHDVPVEHGEAAGRILFDVGLGLVAAAPGGILLRAESPDDAGLAVIKFMLASHLLEHPAAADAAIAWTGDGCDDAVLPSLRELQVRRVEDLTPRMRRITFAGRDLARYDAPDMHVHLLIPPLGRPPAWPVPGPTGIPLWPQDEARPAIRTYTIRRIDPAAGEIAIDFVRHAPAGGAGPDPDGAGPGTAFAERARPGDVVGILGPGGRTAGDAEWYLLAGDETALPAIGRILERLPAGAAGVAVIEVADAGEEQPLAHPPGVALRWLHRGPAPAGSTSLILDAVRAVEIPAGRRVFAWAGTEFETFKGLRAHWRRACGLDRTRHLAVAYWRRGATADEEAA